MDSTLDFRFYLITDRHQCRGRDLAEVVKTASQAGVKAVQIREKDLSALELLNLSRRIRAICEPAKTKVLINDRADVAQASHADGVHLTSHSVPADVIRQSFPSLSLIGSSTHSIKEAQSAAEAGCDFVLFGPIFEMPAKLAYGPPQGLSKLRSLTKSVSIPVFAVGGINAERVEVCLEYGAWGVAVISSIMQADKISAAVAAFKREIGTL